MAQLHFYISGEKHTIYDLPLEEIYLKLTKFNNRSELISKLNLDENVSLILHDDYKRNKRILYKEDIENIKKLFYNRTFLRYLVQEKFYLFSKRVRNNVQYGYGNKLTVDLIYKEINDLKRNNKIAEYYQTIAEVYECRNSFLAKYNEKDNSKTSISEPNMQEEIEEIEETEEFLETTDFYKSKCNSVDDEIYDFFDYDSFESCYDYLNALVINLDNLDESDELITLFERCKVQYTSDCNLLNLRDSDFVIYIGNYSKEVLQDLMKNNKPLIFLNISNRTINVENDMLTSINGFDEEKIVQIIKDLYKKQKRDSYEY